MNTYTQEAICNIVREDQRNITPSGNSASNQREKRKINSTTLVFRQELGEMSAEDRNDEKR